MSLIKKTQRDIYLKTNSVNDKSGLVNSLFLGVGNSYSVAMLLQCLTDGAGTRHFGTQSICVKQEKGVCIYKKCQVWKELMREEEIKQAWQVRHNACPASNMIGWEWIFIHPQVDNEFKKTNLKENLNL